MEATFRIIGPDPKVYGEKIQKHNNKMKEFCAKEEPGKIEYALAALAANAYSTHIYSNGNSYHEFNLDDFRVVGQFGQGNATYNGKPLNGKIRVANPNGDFELLYRNGKLVKSTKMENDRPISEKIYERRNDDEIVVTKRIVSSFSPEMTKNVEKITTKPDRVIKVKYSGYDKPDITTTEKISPIKWRQIKETNDCVDGEQCRVIRDTKTGDILSKVPYKFE